MEIKTGRKELKTEYLLIKTQNDFCSTVDQFKSLLLSNKRLSIDENSIQFSGVSFDYTLTAQEVVWKKNKEIVFYLPYFPVNFRLEPKG